MNTTVQTTAANTQHGRELMRELFAVPHGAGVEAVKDLQQQDGATLAMVQEMRTEFAEVKRLLRLLVQGQRQTAIRLDEGLDAVMEAMEDASGFLIDESADGENYG